MKQIKKIAIILLVMNIMGIHTHAQKNKVHGKVTAFQNIPVEMAKVTNKKNKSTILTDSLGGFEIEAAIKDKITVRVDGFKSSSVKVKNLTDSIQINLVFDGKEEDLILAANKGHLHKVNLPQAIEFLNSPKPFSFGYNNLEALIQGKFPQVEVSNGTLRIRGSSSMSGGSTEQIEANNAALIILDGTPSTYAALKSMAITDIKNMEILKGPAAARYGAGGGNGVLYVKTVSK